MRTIDPILVNKMKDIFEQYGGPRDHVFRDILGRFNNRPINILQVGAIEITTPDFRAGSGWCDFFFGEYVHKNGGYIIVVDIDPSHLLNSAHALSNFSLEENLLVLADAKNMINREFDLIYLDGSNDPKETLEQFELIDLSKTCVLIDDTKIKGTMLNMDLPFEYFDVANGMMFLDMRTPENEYFIY